MAPGKLFAAGASVLLLSYVIYVVYSAADRTVDTATAQNGSQSEIEKHTPGGLVPVESSPAPSPAPSPASSNGQSMLSRKLLRRAEGIPTRPRAQKPKSKTLSSHVLKSSGHAKKPVYCVYLTYSPTAYYAYCTYNLPGSNWNIPDVTDKVEIVGKKTTVATILTIEHDGTVMKMIELPPKAHWVKADNTISVKLILHNGPNKVSVDMLSNDSVEMPSEHNVISMKQFYQYLDEMLLSTPNTDDAPVGFETDLTETNCVSSNIYCATVYEPVCASDGRTEYSNKCEAEKACELNYTDGPCSASIVM